MEIAEEKLCFFYVNFYFYKLNNLRRIIITIAINKPLKEIVGTYEVIGEIYCKLPGIGNTVLNKGTILTVDENHPLYEDIEFYYNEKILKKL